MVLALAAARRDVEKMQEAFAKAQRALADYMETHQRKTVKITDEGFLFQATYSRQTSVKIDEDGLRKKMGAKEFDQYTVKKLDRKALEQALDDNEALQLTVAPFVSTTQSEPFIRLTIKEDKSEEPPDVSA